MVKKFSIRGNTPKRRCKNSSEFKVQVPDPHVEGHEMVATVVDGGGDDTLDADLVPVAGLDDRVDMGRLSALHFT